MDTVVTLTMNPALDLSAAVENVFPNHKLRCGQQRCDPGGGGINVSRAMHRLGGESLALYCAGGTTGQLLTKLLEDAGLSPRPIPIAGSTRENVNVFENSTGQQYRFVMPGPHLTPDEWRRALDAVAALRPPPSILVASGSLPPGVPEDFYALLARAARAHGTRVVLDTSGPPLVAALREGVFLVKPSLRELRAFGNGRVEHEEDQLRAAKTLIEAGRCEVVVVSLGAAGALLVSATECEHLHAPSVSVRSRIGAGDSMVAGIALSLASGESLRRAVCHGVAAGTAAVTNSGTELCHRGDVEKFLGPIERRPNP